MKTYWSFGGGVNSVAGVLLSLDQGEDFEGVFVDHGTDWPETYEYLEMFQSWLKNNGHRPVTVLKPSGKYKTLLEECEAYKIVPSMQRRWCTVNYKTKIVEAYYTKPCFQYIGIDYGELHRAKIRTKAGIEDRWPLIEQEIDRHGCEEIIKAHRLPVPMKSGCFICPMQKPDQWVSLRTLHPGLFCKAKKIEAANIAYRKSKGKKPMFLSASKLPLETIVGEKQGRIFEIDEYPPCQCGL